MPSGRPDQHTTPGSDGRHTTHTPFRLSDWAHEDDEAHFLPDDILFDDPSEEDD